MTPEGFFAMLSVLACFGVGLTFATILLYVQRQTEIRVRLDVIEDKLNMIWNHIYKGAEIDTVNRGMGKMQSPITVHPVVAEWLDALAAELQQFRAVRPGLAEPDLAMEIEREFGARLTETVCIPHGVPLGCVLKVATTIAMAKDVVDAG